MDCKRNCKQFPVYTVEEDLREYYITPEFLERMTSRAKEWDPVMIHEQIEIFRKTLPEYPELVNLLSDELYRRDLMTFYRKVRQASTKRLRDALQKLAPGSDKREMISIEISLRNGERRLDEPEDPASPQT